MTIYFGADNIAGSVNQCHPSNRFGGPKCDVTTTEVSNICYDDLGKGPKPMPLPWPIPLS